MKKVNNVFGEGTIYEEKDLIGKIYATSAACMSVWSDFLSWANHYANRMVDKVQDADSLVVLGCQVTDLAVLNDLQVAEKLHNLTGKDIYVGGCLAQRLDIPLPDYCKRLDVVRVIGQVLDRMDLVHYEKPFWVPDFEETEEVLAPGNLFRNDYPLKIGAGCHGKCKYCTIRHTRGENYTMIPENQIDEFLNHENVVLISDSPTADQIKGWCQIAHTAQKDISIRNVEPQNLNLCEEELLALSQEGLLRVVHCPVQSFDPEVLKIMNRNVNETEKAVELMKKLRENGTLIATNIIIDYVNDGKLYPNHDKEKLENEFDYYSWNPYFDGNWDQEKAKVRFKKYIGSNL